MRTLNSIYCIVELNMQFAHMFMDQNQNSINVEELMKQNSSQKFSSEPVSNVFFAEVNCMDSNRKPFICAPSSDLASSQKIDPHLQREQSQVAIIRFTLHHPKPPIRGMLLVKNYF